MLAVLEAICFCTLSTNACVTLFATTPWLLRRGTICTSGSTRHWSSGTKIPICCGKQLCCTTQFGESGTRTFRISSSTSFRCSKTISLTYTSMDTSTWFLTPIICTVRCLAPSSNKPKRNTIRHSSKKTTFPIAFLRSTTVRLVKKASLALTLEWEPCAWKREKPYIRLQPAQVVSMSTYCVWPAPLWAPSPMHRIFSMGGLLYT